MCIRDPKYLARLNQKLDHYEGQNASRKQLLEEGRRHNEALAKEEKKKRKEAEKMEKERLKEEAKQEKEKKKEEERIEKERKRLEEQILKEKKKEEEKAQKEAEAAEKERIKEEKRIQKEQEADEKRIQKEQEADEKRIQKEREEENERKVKEQERIKALELEEEQRKEQELDLVAQERAEREAEKLRLKEEREKRQKDLEKMYNEFTLRRKYKYTFNFIDVLKPVHHFAYFSGRFPLWYYRSAKGKFKFQIEFGRNGGLAFCFTSGIILILFIWAIIHLLIQLKYREVWNYTREANVSYRQRHIIYNRWVETLIHKREKAKTTVNWQWIQA